MLSSKALLVNVSISQWTGRKIDRTATNTVEFSHNTQKDVGNYTKKLLPQAKALQKITNLAGGIRGFFYEQTLPWQSEGARILPAKSYLDFVKEFNVLKTEYDVAVDSFLNEYPNLREEARIQLGNLFNGAEYPTTDELEHKFNCDVSYFPLPDVSDFRVDLLESEKQVFIERIKTVEANAMKDCWNRLYTVVSKAVEKLNTPEGVFRDSLLDNITELCSLLPKLNITDDPELEAMRRNIENIVTLVSPKDCRDSAHVRTTTAQKLSDITSKMNVFMGVK